MVKLNSIFIGVFGAILLVSRPLFAAEVLCWTSPDPSLIAHLSGLEFKDEGQGHFTVIHSEWNADVSPENIVVHDLGAFDCRSEGVTASFTGLFVCTKPNGERTQDQPLIYSKIIDSSFLKPDGQRTTVESLQLTAWISRSTEKHLEWNLVKCEAGKTFAELVEEIRILR